MNVPFLDLSRVHKKLKNRILNKISNIIDESSFILGKEVSKFEHEFEKYCNVKYAISVASGTDAIKIILLSLIKKGDEVITTPSTFIATTEAISQAGGKIVFVDIDKDTYNLDVNKLENVISKKTKVVIPVNLYGQPCDYSRLNKIANKYNLFIVEDACQSHGAEYKNIKSGNLGIASAFSFYPSKNLGAMGDGGIITTNNKDIYDRCLILRNHGQDSKYTHIEEGFNSRLDSFQASLLRIKLKYLDAWNIEKGIIANVYNKELKLINSIKTQKILKDTKSSFHVYVIECIKRNDLKDYLISNGIQIGFHYPIALHNQKAYKKLGYKKGSFPVSELHSERLISLPIFPGMKIKEVKYICKTIKKFFKNEN